ncbi:hypothetical protein K474DRAFT_1657603 [Panus rudis PR-1116 ss-1]|nr:hypothetical protein K474DRAFT_1657603 [Panus rudis PR-1116 ss-1]
MSSAALLSACKRTSPGIRRFANSRRSTIRFASHDTARKSPPSPHAHFYSDLVPGMIPIALLGSAVYMGLRLLQSHWSHEKYLDEARSRIAALEAELELLRLQPQVVADTTSAQPSASASISSKKWWFW